MERTKECTKCGVEKPLTGFSKHRLSKDGYAYQCKECNALRSKIWKSTPSGIYTNIIGRSNHYKKTGTKVSKPIKISQEEFIAWHKEEPKFCAYCDIPEKYVMILPEHYKMRRERLSVDCMDNLRGYEVGNMVLACGRCNFIKSDTFSYEEMRSLAQAFVKPKWKALENSATNFTFVKRGAGFPTIKIEKGEEND